MKARLLAKYALCLLLGGTAGYLLGQSGMENAQPAASDRPHAVFHAKPEKPAKGSGAIPQTPKTIWGGNAAALGPSEGTLTARLELAEKSGDPFSLALAVQLLGEMTGAEAPAVLEFLKTHPELAAAGGMHNGPPVWQAFWMAWGAADPEAALTQVAAGVPKYPFSERAEAYVFNGLVMKDPYKAAELAESRTDEVSKKWAAEATACRWADTDPKAATEWALSRLDGPYQAAALKGIPWSIARMQGAGEALRWWQSLPEGMGMRTAFGSLVEIAGRAENTPLEDTLALFNTAGQRGLRSENLELLLASKYAESDPPAGIAVLGRQPPVENGEPYHPIQLLVRQWAGRDPEAAGTWLKNQNGQVWGDAAVRGYISAIEKENPEAAAQWKATLGTPAP